MFHIQSGNGKSTRRISSHDSSHGSPCAILMNLLKKITGLLLATLTLAGCAAEPASPELSAEEAPVVQTVPRETLTEGNIHDNDALYKEQDPASVINMYLTVSKGNEADSSNHTWADVNAHSTYYYDDLGIDRYKVEGILQIDDGDGLGEGSYGYGEIVPNVTVQIRGQTSSLSASKNYKIRIKAGKEEYNGQRTLALNKHVSDPYRFLNKMCYDLLADIPQLLSARTQFVRLYVKDTTVGGSGNYVDYGLYTMVEQINRTYLKNHGLDERGELYKVNMFEWYDYDEIMAIGDDYDEGAFESYLEIKGSDDHANLRDTLTRLQNYSIPITEIIENDFDAENLCYWMAFQILIGNYDSGPRNAYIYSPQNSQKWYFIFWDMDASFRRNYFQKIGYLDGLSWEHGLTKYVSLVLFQRMMKEECYRKQLEDAIHDLMEHALSPDKISERAAAYSKVVKYDIFNNAFSNYNSQLTPKEYDRYVDMLSSEIQINYEYYLDSLACPWPFFVNTPESHEDSIFFSWGTAYDLRGESVTYDYQLATDYQFRHILSTGSDLAIPYARVGLLDPGTYYLKVTATNESGHTTDCFDYYSIANVGKIYGCYVFTVEPDGTISVYAGEDV